MPKRFPKQMWDVRAKLRGAPSYDDPFFQERIRSMSPTSALRRVKRNYRPYNSELKWEALPVQGPELPASLEEYRLRELARQRAAEAQRRIRNKKNNRMYAYVGGLGSWRDADDEMFELAGDNYYDMAKDLLWQGDLSVLGPEDLEIANQQLEPFRGVHDDEAFGRMLGERLGDRERFLFGLRRGGVRAKPAYISPTALEELNDVPWRGDYDSYKWLKRNVGFEDPEGYPEDDF